MEENGTWRITCPYCGTFNSFLEGTDNGTETCIFCCSDLRKDDFLEWGDSENDESK